MKKRLKILTTITAMLVTMIFLSYGIYAAASVSVTVQSTMTYQVSTDSVGFKLSYAYGKRAAAFTSTLANTDATYTTVGDVKAGNLTVNINSSHAPAQITFDDQTFDATNIYIFYSFLVENIAETPITSITGVAALTTPGTATATTPSNVTITNFVAYSSSLAKGNKTAIFYQLKVDNTNIDVSAFDVKLTITIK